MGIKEIFPNLWRKSNAIHFSQVISWCACSPSRRLQCSEALRQPHTSPSLTQRIGLACLANLAISRTGGVSASEYKFARGAEIFGAEESAEYIYQVIEGARFEATSFFPTGVVRSARFIWRATSSALERVVFHRFTAEAIVETTVRLMKRENLERVAKTNAAIVHNL